MRHYSPDFGESGYVWILSVYLHRKLHVFKVMMSVSHIDATRTQPACPHGKRWVWLAILLSFVEKKMSEFLNRATESLGSTVLPQNRQTFTFMVAIAPLYDCSIRTIHAVCARERR